jgi:hypothetical protein
VAWQNSQSDGGGYNDCCLEWEPYLATCNFEEGENCEDCRDRVEGELGCQGCGHDNNGPCSDCESGGGGM